MRCCHSTHSLLVGALRGSPGGSAAVGELLCGRFWRWMLLVCRLFTHDSHDLKHTTSSRCSKPSCPKQSGGRTFLVMPRFQHRFLVGKWFGGTCNVLKLMQNFTRLTQQHAMFPCVSLTSTDDPNHFQGSKKNQQLLRTSRTCPPSNGPKNTYWPQRASIPTKTRSGGCFLLWDGCGNTKNSPSGKNKQICRC